MKKFYIPLLVYCFAVCFAAPATAQDVYWREGFEAPGEFPSVAPAFPTYVQSSASGVWYIFLATRNNSSQSCGNTLNHARFYNYNNFLGANPALTANDSAYMVTPVVDQGIGELHFARGRAGRRFTIYKTSDTAANTSNWVLVSQSTTTIAQLCADSTWPINDAAARRVKIVARSGTDSDIDSVWLTSTSPIMPVKFAGIHAVSVNGINKLTWNMTTEQNTYSYIVERSAEGVRFAQVAELMATNAGSYTWMDNNAAVGTLYYRIKAMDKDGKMHYSGVLRLTLNNVKPAFVIAPNAVTGRILNLQWSNVEKGALILRVCNNIGQVMYSAGLQNEGGAVSKSIQLPATMPAGIYRVQLITGKTMLTQAVILQ